MPPWTRWIGIGASIGIVSALVPVVQGRFIDPTSPTQPLAKLENTLFGSSQPPSFDGLDLTRMDIRPNRVEAPLSSGRKAELTLDANLQRATLAELGAYRIPETGAILMDTRSGKLLVYASYVNEGAPFDVNVRARAPAASLFKVITGAALIERGGLNAGTQQCYHGGKSRISADELIDNPERDRWCASLAEAMGRSLNVVFGRLAQKHLTPDDVTKMAGAFGFGTAVPFAVENEAPSVDIPNEPLEFARTAAGFWHSALSPLAAVSMAQTIASKGVTFRPRIVAKVFEKGQKIWEDDDKPRVVRRAIKSETSEELTRMMVTTAVSGSARPAFFDNKGNAFLPGISVAGKTGTLTEHKTDRHYTWFIAFAPSNNPEVAAAVLVVNTPTWKVKAPTLARNLLKRYFAKQIKTGNSETKQRDSIL